MKKLILIISVILATPALVFAHQLRIVKEEITKVQNPEISQAFYGKLAGHPQYFEINSDKKFSLYVGILVPDIKGIKTNISAEVIQVKEEGREVIDVLDGTTFLWSRFYEPFAGDNYFKGPEFSTEAQPGKYLIHIFSFCHPEPPVGGEGSQCQSYQGKYALVIGQQESFSLGETWRTLQLLPALKKDFFGKSPLTMFFNYIGLGLVAVLLILAVIIFLLAKVVKKIIIHN